MNAGSDSRLVAWSRLRSSLESLLHQLDPDGMGASVGAPLDEYADVAISVIRALRDRKPGQNVSEAVWEVVPGANQALTEAIEAAWGEYQLGV